jgi:DNA-binding NarL/FixJ family response regulator
MQLTMKPSSVKAKTVVIIEDQTAIRELVSEMLQAKGKFRVIGAVSYTHLTLPTKLL